MLRKREQELRDRLGKKGNQAIAMTSYADFQTTCNTPWRYKGTGGKDEGFCLSNISIDSDGTPKT